MNAAGGLPSEAEQYLTQTLISNVDVVRTVTGTDTSIAAWGSVDPAQWAGDSDDDGARQ